MVSTAVLSSFNQSIAHKNSNPFPTKYSPFQLARTHLRQTLTGEQPVVILQDEPGLHRGPLILLEGECSFRLTMCTPEALSPPAFMCADG